MPSARMMQASLPDCTVTPWMRSATLTIELSGANMAEPPDGAPPVRQACSAHLELILELDAASLQLAKHERKRHELAHARRRHQRVGILLVEDEIGVGIHEDGVLGLGLEAARAPWSQLSAQTRNLRQPRQAWQMPRRA